jgi:hypothetical protein
MATRVTYPYPWADGDICNYRSSEVAAWRNPLIARCAEHLHHSGMHYEKQIIGVLTDTFGISERQARKAISESQARKISLFPPST